MKLIIIAACSENNVIGVNNSLPWRLPNDLKFFKKQTLGKCVLMGRKTLQSIGNPLPDRTNIILSRRIHSFSSASNTKVISSLEGAKHLAEFLGFTELYVIGGEQVYNQTLPQADIIFLTRVHTIIEGDTFFPWEEVRSNWKLVSVGTNLSDDEHPYPYTFLSYARE